MYVCVITLDFSKAFNQVRHSTLLAKLANLDLPDNVFNWLVNFYRDHSHCSRYGGDISELLEITASIVQGSAIGPYVVTAADLTTTVPGNSKYADDTYVIVPASNVDTRSSEVNNVEAWAEANNLTLNHNKSVEIVFTTKRKRQFTPPPLLSGITCVRTMKMLGVTISYKLSVSDHVQNIVGSCACYKNTACTRHVPGRYTDSFPMCCRCQTYVRSQCLVRLCYGGGSAASGGSYPQGCALWTVPFRYPDSS